MLSRDVREISVFVVVVTAVQAYSSPMRHRISSDGKTGDVK
jgi:hypothetical protein